MIRFKQYRSNNCSYIASHDLDPHIFPLKLFGPVKCGMYKNSGELIRLSQSFSPKSRTFLDINEFSWENDLNSGIWVYFKNESSALDFIYNSMPLSPSMYDKIPGVIPYNQLRKRVYMP